MITAGDLQRWIHEASPALQGGFAHRVWRQDDAWLLLVRHHEDGDPEARAVHRVALEIGLGPDGTRCVALPPEAVQADDKQLKKTWSKDAHPFLGLLRRHLVGSRVAGLEQVENDRVALLRADQGEGHEGPRRLLLSVELIGRQGNLILCNLDDDETPLVLGSLNAGKAKRPFERGRPYRLPPARPAGSSVLADSSLAPDTDPDPKTLALGQAVAAIQRAESEAARLDSRQGELLRAAKKARKRAVGVLKKLDSQLAEVARADEYERRGDLIKANLGSIPRGATRVEVTDYTATPDPVVVELELDGTKDAQDQMKAAYKRAKKLRSGEGHILLRQGETDANLAELSALQVRLEEVDPQDAEALDDLEDELRKRGALPKPNKGPRVKQQENQGPRSYLSREGHEILVGRNDDENDKLTMRIARGRDLFFHVSGCPGSHVILRVDRNRPPNHESILDAATVAVHYSKARQRATAVDVSYTPRKWVQKPKGAKPGLVRISNHKTVRTPKDPVRLQRVLDSASRGEDEK